MSDSTTFIASEIGYAIEFNKTGWFHNWIMLSGDLAYASVSESDATLSSIFAGVGASWYFRTLLARSLKVGFTIGYGLQSATLSNNGDSESGSGGAFKFGGSLFYDINEQWSVGVAGRLFGGEVEWDFEDSGSSIEGPDPAFLGKAIFISYRP